MKKWLFSFLLFFLFLESVSANQKLYVFHRYDCPHCKRELAYLKTIQEEYPNVDFIYLEVVKNKENLKHLENVKKTLKDENNYVPYTVIGQYTLVGFNEAAKEQIKIGMRECIEKNCKDIVGKVMEEKRVLSLEEERGILEEESFHLPFLGKVEAKNISLPLLSIVLGFLDGFNPCAMWVLLFLMSMLLGMKNRRKMWLLGGTFLFTSATIYTLFLVAWLKVNLALQDIVFLRYLIALIALGASLFHLMRYGKMRHTRVGCTVANSKRRNKIMHAIRKFTKEKSLILSLIGVISLAISVHFIELACSAGFPIVYTKILSLHDISLFAYFWNLFLYIFFYLIDDFIVFCIAMFTLKITGITNKYSKYAHLLGGILLLLIGLLLLFQPTILTFSI